MPPPPEYSSADIAALRLAAILAAAAVSRANVGSDKTARKEMEMIPKAAAEYAETSAESALVGAVFGSQGGVDFSHDADLAGPTLTGMDSAALAEAAFAKLREAAALVQSTSGLMGLVEYRRGVVYVCMRVAESQTEGGPRVSEAERTTIERVTAALTP